MPLTGCGDAKKSMSFPMVKGIDRETDEDTTSRLMADRSALRSGRARRAIFPIDETFATLSGERRDKDAVPLDGSRCSEWS